LPGTIGNPLPAALGNSPAGVSYQTPAGLTAWRGRQQLFSALRRCERCRA
jgi:hypothetical protein